MPHKPQKSGEMAARIRDFDWFNTPLSPIEAWPQSLPAIIDLVLGSPVATILLWGLPIFRTITTIGGS